MATLKNTRDRIDGWLSARWPLIQARQDNYLASRGKYWQGLITHTVPPTHTTVNNDTEADLLNAKPHDQPETWADFFPEAIGITFPAALQMDLYKGPLGDGYVAAITVIWKGTTYSRSQAVGPETWRTESWHIVTEPDV